jgi:Domain of unknown function (DUF222)
MSETHVEELDRLHAGLDALLASLRGGLARDDVLTVVREYEAFRNRLPLVDHLLVGLIEQHDIAERICAANPGKVLQGTLRISPLEGHRRVQAAEALADRQSMLGETQPPRRPRLAAAQRAGEVSPEQVAIVERALRRFDLLAPALLAQAEADLVGYARVFAPPELRRLADRMVEAIDPDGTRPREERQRDLRSLRLSPTRDGMMRIEGRLTSELAASCRPSCLPWPSPARPPCLDLRVGSSSNRTTERIPSGCTTRWTRPARGCRGLTCRSLAACRPR